LPAAVSADFLPENIEKVKADDIGTSRLGCILLRLLSQHAPHHHETPSERVNWSAGTYLGVIANYEYFRRVPTHVFGQV
jgi:hypothetical protein